MEAAQTSEMLDTCAELEVEAGDTDSEDGGSGDESGGDGGSDDGAGR